MRATSCRFTFNLAPEAPGARADCLASSSLVLFRHSSTECRRSCIDLNHSLGATAPCNDSAARCYTPACGNTHQPVALHIGGHHLRACDCQSHWHQHTACLDAEHHHDERIIPTHTLSPTPITQGQVLQQSRILLKQVVSQGCSAGGQCI